jgi:hypothetical protein
MMLNTVIEEDEDVGDLIKQDGLQLDLEVGQNLVLQNQLTRTNQGDKTNLKKPGRRQESRAALDREFKPRRESPNTWSKPSAKEDYKKPTKPGTMNRPKPSHPTKSKKSK